METNKIDNNIKEKFANRTLKPSVSAWERLSVQLDEQPKEKKKGWFFYIGIAASILLIVSLSIQVFSDKTEQDIPKNEVVKEEINKELIDKKIDDFVNEIPAKKVLVKSDRVEVEQQKSIKNSIPKKEIFYQKNLKRIPNKKEKLVVAKLEDKNENSILPEIKTIDESEETLKEIEKRILIQDPNSTIKINADDLLYAVTHSPKEVKTYYAKYKIDREDVLKTIKNELKKSNIKINPESILAEVETTIQEQDFQNNFLKSIRRRVTDIAAVIASRND